MEKIQLAKDEDEVRHIFQVKRFAIVFLSVMNLKDTFLANISYVSDYIRCVLVVRFAENF
jgi:hypothetical protein